MHGTFMQIYVRGYKDSDGDGKGDLKGLISQLDYLQDLGVQGLWLMPVTQSEDRDHGYAVKNYRSIDTDYGSLADMAQLLMQAHQRGIGVILDHVINHASSQHPLFLNAASSKLNPQRNYFVWQDTLPSAWRVWDQNPWHSSANGHYFAPFWSGMPDFNWKSAQVKTFHHDNLRFWLNQGVDGFRFDLAPVLGRDASPEHRFQTRAPLFMALAQDPVLRDRLLIAEPWDVGPGGYQLGQFPPGWLEWNDLFRDTQRAAWLHGHANPGRWAQALAGSSAAFGGRAAHSSVNFVTAHDGFSLQDLVSYQHKHNEANGEANRDGHSHNLSHNHGVEGPTDDPVVQGRRRQSQRALLMSSLLALGTPMLLAGDEFGHSQGGNNNAYCQDNALTWLDWETADLELCRFVAAVLALRHELPLLQARDWWRAPDDEAPNQAARAHWLTPEGQPLSARDWQRDHPVPMAIWLLPARPDEAACLWLLNPSAEPVTFALPPGRWSLRLDSHAGATGSHPLLFDAELPARSVQLAVACISDHD